MKETEGQLLGRNLSDIIMHIWEKLKGTFHKMSEELLSPPTISAVSFVYLKVVIASALGHEIRRQKLLRKKSDSLES